MDGPLSKVEYKLHAIAKGKEGEKINLDKTLLQVKRAIFPNDLPKRSIRIFPPTNLAANVGLPSVVYPIGESTATMRIEGIIRREPSEPSNMHHQWRLKRMIWRIEETHKVLSPACPKHSHAAKSPPATSTTEAPDKRTTTTTENNEFRTIGTGEMRHGWKSDYSHPTGSIELEFPFGIHQSATCDTKTAHLDISHQLVVELIVAEDQAPDRKPWQTTPTGAARILRMHFNVTVTERSGLGISWDEEIPPVYEDVPASPPGYLFDYFEGGEALFEEEGEEDGAVPDYALLPL